MIATTRKRRLSKTRRGLRNAALCALLAAAAQAAAAGGAPAPAAPLSPGLGAGVGPNTRLNGPQSPAPATRTGRPGETIAADSTGKLLVASWETLQGVCGPPFGEECTAPKRPGLSEVAYSTDGGQTWKGAGAPFLGKNVMSAGHSWIDRGGSDRESFFLVARAMDTTPKPQDMTPGGPGQLGLVVYRGRFQDGAFSWSDEHLLTPGPGRPGDLFRSPSVLAAKDGSGRVFVTYTALLALCGRPGRSCGQIEVYRSADDGKTWEGPVVVGPDDTLSTADPADPLCGSKGTYQVSSSAALGPQGDLYVVWPFGPRLLSTNPISGIPTFTVRLVRSTDGGKTFGPARDLATANSMAQNAPVAYSKVFLNDYPRIAVAAEGPHRGRLYVTYTSALVQATGSPTEQNLISSQVYLVHSDDRGETWSAPVPLVPPPPPTGVKRFWPTVAVRANGQVDVLYVESQERQATPAPDDVECNVKLGGAARAGKVSSLVDTYWVQSTDGGDRFGAPVRVSTATSNWCTASYHSAGSQFANFGDYLGLTTAGDRAFAVWTDGRDGVPDAYFAELKSAAAPGGAEAKPAKSR